MRRFADVSLAIAWRAIHNFATNPAFVVPSLLFPLFFLVAFAGGLSSVGDVPGFDFPTGYTAFQFVFVLLQASTLGGIFTGFAIAADFENGFARRLLVATPNRLAILAGYLMAALARATFVGLIVFVVAVGTGMDVDGTVVDMGALALLALSMSLIATLFAAGVATRMRTLQAGPLMQMPAFILLFLAPVYVPVELLDGWIKTAARVNPFTPVVETGRGLISGQGAPAGLAAAALAAMAALMAVWALLGLRRAEREPT